MSKLQVAVQEEQDRIEAVAKSQAFVDQRTAKALVDVLVGQCHSHSRTSEKADQQDRTY